MVGTSEGAAKRRRCACGAFAHAGPCSTPGPKPRPLEERLARKIQRGEPDECWPWTGAKTKRGYGTYGGGRGGPRGYVARYLLEQHLGRPLRPGEVTRHSCDNPPCCNPTHLLVGTQKQNLADMVDRGRSNAGERHWNWQGGKGSR